MILLYVLGFYSEEEVGRKTCTGIPIKQQYAEKKNKVSIDRVITYV